MQPQFLRSANTPFKRNSLQDTASVETNPRYLM